MDKNIYSSHKLLKHLDRLVQWQENKFPYPISIDLDLTDKCNHRCPLCISSGNEEGVTIEFEKVKDIINQLEENKAKSIKLTGGGEPTCHPNLNEIIKIIKEKDIDVAIQTNGYELSDELIETIVKCCSWMRISLDAGSPEVYKKTHGMDEKAFHQVLNNISKLVKAKNLINSQIVIGVTYLIGPHTLKDMYNSAKICKELGANYIRFRSFEGQGDIFSEEEEKEISDELEKCEKLNDQNFSASARRERLKAGERKRNYNECPVINFIASIDANLDVYPCCVLKDKKKYSIGNLRENTFKEIWFSEKKKKIFKEMSLCFCHNPCQYESQIQFLNSLNSQITHSNFL